MWPSEHHLCEEGCLEVHRQGKWLLNMLIKHPNVFNSWHSWRRDPPSLSSASQVPRVKYEEGSASVLSTSQGCQKLPNSMSHTDTSDGEEALSRIP